MISRISTLKPNFAATWQHFASIPSLIKACINVCSPFHLCVFARLICMVWVFFPPGRCVSGPGGLLGAGGGFYRGLGSQSMGSAVNPAGGVAGNDVTPAIYVK